MNYSSDELCKQIADKTGGICILAFSTGKDALSAYAQLKKYFTTIHMVYYYSAPGLQFVERSLQYYEQAFQTRIIRLPNPNLIRQLNAGTFQSDKSWKIAQSYQFPEVTRDWMCEQVKIDFNIPKDCYVAIGNRMYDSISRYRSITKFGAVNHKNKTFYPVFDFKIKDVVEAIKTLGVKLPVDYKIWGKTFDGLDYRFIKPLKEHFPSDFAILKSFFPLIETEILRYDKL